MSPADRLDALAQAARAGREVLPEDVLADVRAVEDRAGHRLRLSAEHTVVAFAGATGSGKSSLLNALVGEDLAAVDVLRPTTSEAFAVVRGDEGSTPLLDWLSVRRRHVLDEPAGGAPVGPSASPGPTPAAGGGGLVLLDLPDHDSVVVEHRLEAERLVALVDLMVWVVDPQKYADAVLHERYLRNLSAHRDVLLVVLNQVDRLRAEERVACTRDLSRLLAEDGLAGVPVLELSARTGEGVDALRQALDEAARRRQAATARVLADLTAIARRVLEECPERPPGRAGDARSGLLQALEVAAGVPLVVDAVRRGWALRGRRATGWPPTRWVARFRPDPLRRLHLGGPGRPAEDPDGEVARTSLPAPGPAEQARARSAVRRYTDARTAGLPDRWVLAAREVEGVDLADDLDQAVARTPAVPSRRPVWWGVVGGVQWLLLLVAVGGALWLGALAGLAYLQVPAPEPPRWGDVPWPTVALVGGVVLGVAVAVLARLAVALAARRHARRVAVRLRAAVEDVADRRVVAPVDAVLARMDECREAATRAAGEGRGRRPGRGGGR